MQASRLNALGESIANGGAPGVNSLIVIRHGYLVTERYFNGTRAAQAQTVQSVTKSVASLLAGIAIDKGFLTADARILTALPQYDDLASTDARKRDIGVTSPLWYDLDGIGELQHLALHRAETRPGRRRHWWRQPIVRRSD